MDVTINEDVLEKQLKDILPTVDASAVTIKTISEMIRKRLDASQEDLVAWKPALKALIPKMLDWCKNQSNTQPDKIDDKVINASYPESDEALESQSDYSGSEVDRKQTEKKRKAKSETKWLRKANPIKKTRINQSYNSDGFQALKELARVAGVLNPAIYRKLKSVTNEKEAEDLVRDRLKQSGISFLGDKYPSKLDIANAKKKKDAQRELEGIDTNLIVHEGRRRCTSQKMYPIETSDTSDAEEEDDDAHQSESSSEASFQPDDE
ncbi:unnamed protein product [Albugo candida]|uniref:DEK C-terminal domain-containing protein n=1 Tax=Albugo candida TaxID=65357 RepID=A0A024GVT8_9STRA|nr:unnamed protein product [Albugo candida]|eukprot:CCI50831.1 unnamed protein product [Albugo candida]